MAFKATPYQIKNGESKNSSNTGFKATKYRTYDPNVVKEWENNNKNSLTILNDYNERINKSEWLDEEDRKAYRKALDTYIDTSNRLREINKIFGEGYSEEDEIKWSDSIASMNTGYDEISNFYSQFASDKVYSDWQKQQKADEAYKANFSNIDVNKASQGWQKYLDDEEASKQKAIAEEEDKTWWQKFSEFYLEAQGMSTSENPVVNQFNATVDHYRNDVSYMRPNDSWTEEQKNAFGQLYLESPTKAYAFAEEINKRNNKAKEEDATKKIQKLATDNFGAGFGHTIGAIAAAPLALGDYLDDLAKTAAGRDIAPDGNISPFEYSQAVTGGISTHLNEKGGTLDEDIPIIGGKGWGDVYGLGTSIGQSLASAYTLGSVGTLISYFGQGAAAGVDDALARGASEGQALLYGAALGAFEGVAEKIGIDNLFKLGSSSTVKGLLKNILKQAGAEGGEEMFTAIMGNIADALVMQDKSNFAYQIAEYMNDGLSESEAKWKVFGKSLEGIAYDTISGALSGAVSGGLHSGVQTAFTNAHAKSNYSNQTQDLLVEAANLEGAGKAVDKYVDKYGKKGELSGWNINHLLEITDNAKVKSAVEAQLTKLGESGDVSKLADVITKQVQGIELSKKEQSILDSSTFGERVINGLDSEKIKSRMYDTEWAETIGTRRLNADVYNRGNVNAPVQEMAHVMLPDDDKKTSEVTNEPLENAKLTIERDGETVEVKVDKIESIENGETSLKLEDGEVVKADEVDFGNSGIGFVYKSAAEMVSGVGGFNIDAANLMVRGFNPSGTMEQAGLYVNGFNTAYRYGAMGYPVSALETGVETSNLATKVRETAYNLGKAFGVGKVAEKQANIDSAKAINANKDSQKASKNKKGRVIFDGKATEKSLTKTQRANVKGLKVIAEAMGMDIHVFESPIVDGKRVGENGSYDPVTKTLRIDLYAGVKGDGLMLFTASHELTHHIREVSPAKFKVFADALLEEYTKNGVSIDALIEEKLKHLEKNGRLEGKTEEQAYDLAYEEVVADACEAMLVDSNAMEALSKKLYAKDKSLWESVKKFIGSLIAKIKAIYKALNPDSAEANLVRDMADSAERLQKLWVDALLEASNIVEIDTSTESVAPMFSERTWTASEYVTEREETAKKISKALGVSLQTAYKYIDDINGVARLIADDRARLDYEPNLDENATVLKPNSEYKFSVDMSTLCAKRLLFTGTFDAIQKALPNTVFDSEDIVTLREMMQKRDYEVACGICYVESTRREIGRITQEFIDRYKVAQKTGKPISRINSSGKEVVLKSGERTFSADKSYTPNLGELNTTDIDIVKRDHREVYDAYLAFMNARGQAKPKLLETRAEYKGEILKHFKAKSSVEARNNAGGLRLQSFSDFEVPHMIDMMQIVMDMSRVGLKSQAYTKVPAFAEVFGDSGVKINLSLIAKGDGLDSNGNLIFDDVEGINHKEAFKLRDKYSKNVGTILVGKTDAHIIAAMADPRIDFIIPFHKSSWKESLYDALGLTGYADYTETQNEKSIDKSRKIKNFDPSEYWDFSKPGDENAQTYLEKCREDGRIPKFPQFQGYPGYWKLLIDFKMYDNNGVGSPQEVVKPVFNTEASERILREYEGGHKSFPVAKDVVEDFVKEHKDKVKYSDRDSLDNYREKRYNLYTATDDFIRDVAPNDRKAFSRSLANKTSDMADGEIRTIYIYSTTKVYAFRADGYMHGEMVKSFSASNKQMLEDMANEYDKIDQSTKNASLWTETIQGDEGRRGSDSDFLRGGRSDSLDSLYENASERNGARDTEREWGNTYSEKEADEIIKKLREMYGLDTSKYSDRLSEKASYAPTFYSQMGKVVDDIKLEKMGTSSILNHLKNRGVKDEEIKWSGIEAFLEGKKSVTKAELQEFVAGSQLQIEEEMSGAESFDIIKDGEDYIVKDKDGNILDTWERTQAPDDPDLMGWISLEEGDIVSTVEEIREYTADWYGNESARWSQYRLDGGTNYRELVFKMPNATHTNQAMRAHWGEDTEGVLAHARIQDLTVNGKKMLFIEEIQSDWHNEGHQRGYITEEYEEAVAAYNRLMEDHLKKRKAFHQYVLNDDFNRDQNEGNYTKFNELRSESETAEKRMRDAESYVESLKKKGIGDTPDAPFRTTYHEYVLKRLLRMAAEEGYDSIGWTTADIQSKRWSDEYAEGYHIEYDQDIPKFLRKYGKKWGATVGKSSVEGDIEVWSMDIPGSMKKSVLTEGQPLYSDRNTASFNGKAFWSGSVSLLDGVIEEVHTMEEAEDADFHHSMYFSQAQVEKMANEENAFFFVENGNVQGDWRVSIPEDIIERIKEQIEISPSIVEAREFSDSDIKYSIREEAPPKKTKEGYKVFVVKDGKLYPPMVANPNAEDTPVGVWLNADVGTRAPDSKTGRMQVKAGGKGTQGGSGILAFRPGWHLGETPLATQFDRLNPDTGVKELFPENFVWALCDIAADHDYQEEAMSYGYTKNGKFQHSLAGLPKLPTDGYYKYRTNPNPDTVPWLITGAMKVKKLLSDAEVNVILKEKGLAPKQRVGGEKTLTDLGLSKYEGKVFSDRTPDSFSNRSLLANALESAAQNDIERDKLKQYKAKIDLINSEEQKLRELRERIGELYRKKGPRDTEAIKSLQFEANQAANRINTYDRQLLNLESTKALKGVLEREKKLAYQKAEREGKEALERYREKAAKTQRELMTRYQESRKKATESRDKTAMRHKIKDIVSELNTLLLKPTAKKHIKEELRKEVADALLAINMDTVGADERVAMYNDLIAKERNPDIIAELTKTRDNIQLQGDNLKEKLNNLQTAYEKIKNTDDIELNLAYQEVIQNSIKAVSEKVGKTSIRSMTLEQLEMVYDLFKMIRHTIRDANKAFKAKKGETIMQMAEAVNDQVRTVGGQPYKRNAISATLQRIGWTFLKPYVAFRTIGSVTLTNMYKELRNGEDTFYTDVKEAQAFIEDQYKKHGYKSWDMKKTKTFTAKSGKTFSLTLEQMMSLYAYSRRDQAHDHIIDGGIVFEDAIITEKNKWGVPIKYEVTTKDAFNLSEETFTEIVNSLSAEQKAFVDEMQAYLSDNMGAKGNEVSMKLLGVKLFKEKFYLPIKSSQYYMNFKAEEAGEVKLKSPAFSKETVKHANNPIVVHNFTDLWAEHINDMSMYHAFVLALEDFTRVYNYKTKTDAKVETMDTKATLETAYPGVTNYINKFLKDMNGGVRSETVGWADKLTSLSKKGAVLGSWSVTIQQPSAVMRAMAYINPKYFVTTAHKSINLAKHKQDWAELKKYAPIAGIKEMGRFDVGMGQETVDWIKSNKTVMDKAEDIISLPPAFMDEVTWVTIWNAVKRETAHNNPTMNTGSEEFLKLAGERFTEVISLSQVYDSVFSRSDLMRNKSWIAKSLTAFMAEPSTTLNMLWDSWVHAKRSGSVKGYVKATTVTGGAIVAATVLNAALKSIIMAMRDDDEDESYIEKYLEAFVGDLKDSLNPLSLIPFVKDIVSIFKGYDVERMDMAMFSDLKKALDAMDSDSKTLYEKWSGLIGAISAFVGVPFKNVERDIRGLITTVFGKTEETTVEGMLNAIKEGWTGKESSNGQQLYEAMVKGDSAQIKRIEGRFEEQSDIDSAIRKALRENDPRIKEAAEAYLNRDYATYNALREEIVAEGIFSRALVTDALKAEYNYLKKKAEETE